MADAANCAHLPVHPGVRSHFEKKDEAVSFAKATQNVEACDLSPGGEGQMFDILTLDSEGMA
ncbi:hypothetical protein ASE85_11175 [Sphingobium sp. Leaf26]|nr:hypothetical protein ASE85_11175 [Sphingobium sp. Leaf26]